MKLKLKTISIRFVIILNVLAVILLLLTYLAPIVDPESFWIFAFLGLAYPFIVAINILFFVYWVLLLKKYFLISLIGILIGYNTFLTHFNLFNNSGKIEDHSKAIKVLSYNVRLFDFYNWLNANENEVRDDIVEFIDKEDPGIICFQEFFNDESKDKNNMEQFVALKGIKHYHIDYFVTRRKIHHWGIATFSKYPIVNRDRYQFRNSSGNYCIITDILKGSDTIRVYNVHFESWHFQNMDYQFFDDLKKADTEQDSFKSGIKNIYWKMLSSYKKRAEQAEDLIAIIDKSPYPVIVCGDFNDTPSSYVYGTMTSSDLKDSFKECGRGIGRTYAGKFPSFRIDYIMHDPSFRASNFVRIKKKLSDHYPITTTLELEK